MKTLQTILLFALFSTFAQAQITGGGSADNTPSTNNEDKIVKPTSESPIKKYNSFFRVSSVGTRGMYGTSPSPNAFIYEAFNGEDGFGANSGFGFQWNSISYLSLPIIEQVGVGIQYGVGAAFNSVDWSNLNGWDEDDLDFSVGSEFYIGPTVAYNPIDKVVISAALLIIPSYYLSPTMAHYDYDANTGNTYTFSIDPTWYYLTQRGFQLNVQYGGFSFGIEYIGGTGNYDYDLSYSREYYDANFNYIFNSGVESNEAELPIRTTRLLFGFAF